MPRPDCWEEVGLRRARVGGMRGRASRQMVTRLPARRKTLPCPRPGAAARSYPPPRHPRWAVRDHRSPRRRSRLGPSCPPAASRSHQAAAPRASSSASRARRTRRARVASQTFRSFEACAGARRLPCAIEAEDVVLARAVATDPVVALRALLAAALADVRQLGRTLGILRRAVAAPNARKARR